MTSTDGTTAVTGYGRVTDDTFEEVLAAEYAALVVGKSDCGYCRQYDVGIADLVDDPAYADVVFRKLVLDERGGTRIKRENPWILGLDTLPYTVLYRDGEPVDKFAASNASYLEERIREVFLRTTL